MASSSRSARSFPDSQSPWWKEVTLLHTDGESTSGGAKRWKCRYCLQIKNGSSVRVRAHLLGIRNQGVSLCPSVPDSELARLLALSDEHHGIAAPPRPLNPRAFAAGGPSGSSSSSFDTASAFSTPSTSHVRGGRGLGSFFTPRGTSAPVSAMAGQRPSLPREGQDTSHGGTRQASLAATWHPNRRAQVDEAVARFFYGCDVSLNVARSPYFRDMVKEIAQLGPSYAPPSYEALRTKLLDGEKKSVQRALAVFREEWPTYGVSLIGDGWSDTRHRSILGILAYCRGKSCFLKSFDNSEGGKTTERLVEIWSEAIEEVGPQNVIQFIADGEASNRAAGRLLQLRYPHIFFTPCMAHCLNNLLKDIGKLDWVLPILESCREVVTFITRHHYILAVFRRMPGQKDLLKYSETRFAYNFLMLERVAEVKNNLQQLVVSDEWLSWREASSPSGNSCRAHVLSDQFWDGAQHIMSVVMPIIRHLRLMDGDAPCIGKVYEGFDKMIENIKTTVTDETLRDELVELCISRWNSYHVPVQAAAFILDPEFQGESQEKDREVVRGWEATLRVMVPDERERRQVKDELGFYRKKYGLFSYEDCQRDRFRVGSALWWEDYGADTPLLRDLAIRILSQGASSSPCERLWSTYAHTASKKRNRLGTEKANDLLFVNVNLRLLYAVSGEFRREEYIGFTHESDVEEEEGDVDAVAAAAVPPHDDSVLHEHTEGQSSHHGELSGSIAASPSFSGYDTR